VIDSKSFENLKVPNPDPCNFQPEPMYLRHQINNFLADGDHDPLVATANFKATASTRLRP